MTLLSEFRSHVLQSVAGPHEATTKLQPPGYIAFLREHPTAGVLVASQFGIYGFTWYLRRRGGTDSFKAFMRTFALSVNVVRGWRVSWPPFFLCSITHLHAPHLLANMAVLGTVGFDVWGRIGSLPALGLYASSAAFSSAASLMGKLVTKNPLPTVGASGPLYALTAVFALLDSDTHETQAKHVPFYKDSRLLLVGLGLFDLVGMAVFGRRSRFDHAAHLGGLLWGTAFYTVFLCGGQQKVRKIVTPQMSYHGHVVDFVPHGKGDMCLSNGHLMSGTFDSGVLHGLALVRKDEDQMLEYGWFHHGRASGPLIRKHGPLWSYYGDTSRSRAVSVLFQQPTTQIKEARMQDSDRLRIFERVLSQSASAVGLYGVLVSEKDKVKSIVYGDRSTGPCVTLLPDVVMVREGGLRGKSTSEKDTLGITVRWSNDDDLQVAAGAYNGNHDTTCTVDMVGDDAELNKVVSRVALALDRKRQPSPTIVH